MTFETPAGTDGVPVTDRLATPVLLASRRELVSVLVVCCGQLEYTRLCVPGLLKQSSPPFELVFIDAGSVDGTAEFLAGVAAAAPVRVEIVRSVTEQGLRPACQEAVARSRGEFLVLLHNDTVVTSDWLDQLTALARSSPDFGLVGPVSNHASPPQGVEAVPYRLGAKAGPPPGADGLVREGPVDVAAVDRFAREWRQHRRGRWTEVDSLDGFCLLVKRQVLDLVGPLQAVPSLGLIDTDDLCQRAQQAGYRLACCLDLFVHNFGSRLPARPAETASGAAGFR